MSKKQVEIPQPEVPYEELLKQVEVLKQQHEELLKQVEVLKQQLQEQDKRYTKLFSEYARLFDMYLNE